MSGSATANKINGCTLLVFIFLFSLWLFRVSIKESSVAKLGSVCRRVYRIFSHAFFHHRSIYDEFEVRDFYVIFSAFYLYILAFLHPCSLLIKFFHRSRSWVKCRAKNSPSSRIQHLHFSPPTPTP